MSTFDEQTDFTFLALGSSEPATAKKSKAKGKMVNGISVTCTHTYTHKPETRAHMSELRKGKEFSDEHRAKLAEAQTGSTKSAETRAKMAAAKLGKKHSAETKAKMSVSAINCINTEDTLNKRRKLIMTPAGVFKGRKAAAEGNGITLASLDRRLYNHAPCEGYYIIKGDI